MILYKGTFDQVASNFRTLDGKKGSWQTMTLEELESKILESIGYSHNVITSVKKGIYTFETSDD